MPQSKGDVKMDNDKSMPARRVALRGFLIRYAIRRKLEESDFEEIAEKLSPEENAAARDE